MSRVKSTAEMEGPKAPDFVLPATGAVSTEDIPEIEAAETLEGKNSWAEDMMFQNQLVRIRLHETTDPNDEPRVPVQVNGEIAHPQYGNHLPRGIELNVKRCVVEQLAKSKPINVKTVKTMDADGNDTAKIVRTVGQRYPFELIDPRPGDQDWLRRVRAQA